jgi:hypothetical protein
MRAPKWLRPYLPNTSTKLAIVHQDHPADAYWPMRITQIVGGRTWSISLINHRTPTPVPTEKRLAELQQELSLERVFGEGDQDFLTEDQRTLYRKRDGEWDEGTPFLHPSAEHRIPEQRPPARSFMDCGDACAEAGRHGEPGCVLNI